MAKQRAGQIVNVMKEERLFAPSPEFTAKARIRSIEQYQQMWQEAAGDVGAFWAKLACELH
jgi:acetyl-CoA synthetase